MSKTDLSKCKLLGQGRNRMVFLLPSGLNVIKVPLNEDGIIDNWHEHCIRSTGNPYDHQKTRARCRILPGSNCLIMEYLTVMFYPDLLEYYTPRKMKIPDWIGSIDCSQVGLSLTGKVKAYDYGLK